MEDILKFFNREIRVLLIAALPVIELRGAIPIGVALGMSPIHSAVVSLIGSMIPVPFLLFFLKPIFAVLRNYKVLRAFVNWCTARTERKSKNIKKYSLIGLAIFVAVPIPSTGVWTGSAIAAFLNMRIKHSFLAILAGNTIAAVIVTFLSYLAINI